VDYRIYMYNNYIILYYTLQAMFNNNKYYIIKIINYDLTKIMN